MAIYFKLKNQVFKSSDRIIVGRGTPFSILNDDRDVARAHLLVVSKKGILHIKDLKSSSGTKVNGKLIKSNKLIKVTPQDKIYIGEQRLEFLSTAPEENVITITRSSLAKKESLFHLYLYGISILFLGVGIYTFFEEGFSLLTWIAAIFTFALIWVSFKIGIRLAKTFTPPDIREIYTSNEGFTIHYSDEKSMTFKLEDIQSWHIPEKGHILYLKAYDEDYRLMTHGQFLPLITFLEKKLSKRKLEKSMAPDPMMIFLLGIASLAFFTNGTTSILASAVVLLASLAVLFSEKFRQKWPFPQTKMFSRKQQTCSIVIAGLMSAFSINSGINLENNIAMVNKCAAQNKESCLNIDFHEINQNKDLKQLSEAMKVACQHANRSACYYIKDRKMAGDAE